MVKGLGAPKPCTPDALVTCWSVNYTQNRRKDVDHSRGMIFVDAEKPKLFGCCIDAVGGVWLVHRRVGGRSGC